MKYISSLFLLTIAASAYAVSTCETRVDSHQKASTKKRVEYCLMQEPVAVASSGPELVYMSTYSVEPSEEQPVKSTVKEGYFKDDKMYVQHQYVGSRNFPKFTNDTLSEQERAALTEAYLRELDQQYQAAQAATVKKVITQRAPARLDGAPQAQMREMTVANLLQGEPSIQGMEKRQDKPKRFMKTVSNPKATFVTQQPEEPSVESAPQVTSPAAEPAAEPAASADPLLSAAYGDDDFLNEELGLDDDAVSTPIPVPTNK